MYNYYCMEKAAFNPLESLVFLTNRVGRLLANDIQRRMHREIEELQTTHMGVLVDLWLRDGQRQQDLAVSLIKDKGTITRALDAMERNNVVVRVPDERDRRNKRIFLTHKGRKLREVILPHTESVQQEATCGIPEGDLETCKRVLLKMYENLNQSIK